MKEYLKLWAKLIIPVWIVDGCLNKDPVYRLDENTQLIATSSSSPLSLDYRDTFGENRYQLHEVTDFLMNDAVFTGLSEGGYFLVSRADDCLFMFETRLNRDTALQERFRLSLDELRPRPWYAGLSGNAFFPYNLLYYGLATCGAGVYLAVIRRRTGTKPDSDGNAEKRPGVERTQ